MGTQRKLTLSADEWSEVKERARQALLTVPVKHRNESNTLRLALGFPVLVKGGDRVSKEARRKNEKLVSWI